MFLHYLEIGFEHILDLNGYDHILFIIALCAVYKTHQWKQILVLVTAFTIGHSITLAMSVLRIVTFPAPIIEFLIPLTILITALFNVSREESLEKKINLNYFLALFFGMIHGFGFSNQLRPLLGNEGITEPLLAFNIGVELGQIVIVLCTIALGFLFMNVFKTKQRAWNLFISGAAAGVAITLLIETKFW